MRWPHRGNVSRNTEYNAVQEKHISNYDLSAKTSYWINITSFIKVDVMAKHIYQSAQTIQVNLIKCCVFYFAFWHYIYTQFPVSENKQLFPTDWVA